MGAAMTPVDLLLVGVRIAGGWRGGRLLGGRGL